MPLASILIVLVAVACGLFFFTPAWFPGPITSGAIAWDSQFSRTLWIAGIIFIAAHILLIRIILRGRRRSASDRHENGTGRRKGHRWLELTWTTATAILFLTLAVLGSRGWAKVPGQTPGKETIEVLAHQFAWNFRYPGPDGRFGKTANQFISDSGGNSAGIDPADPDGKDDIVTASLRIPAGRDVLLLLHSRDVIHDFFVRELRTKQDIVPGMEIPLEIHVDSPGQYEIACAELCGLGHSQMRSIMIALSPGEYDRWKRQAAP
jgi:cytochrome c oxidase subunit 2